MTLCGANNATKLCEDCAGGCQECPAPWKPPQPGEKVTPGFQGCTTALAKSMPVRPIISAKNLGIILEIQNSWPRETLEAVTNKRLWGPAVL